MLATTLGTMGASLDVVDLAPEELLSAQDGLSAETLQMLMHYQEFGIFADDGDDQGEERYDAPISSETVCVAYTAKDSKVIAETVKRLQEKEDKASLLCDGLSYSESLNIVPLEAPTNETLNAETLKRDGVVRINNVLDKDLCQALLEAINVKLVNADSTEPGFGNVFSRENRYDMYLRPQGLVQQALAQMLNETGPLAKLFQEVLHNEAAPFHEISSLISDPGAGAQPIHPDAKYSAHCPIWTVFCALQDVTEEMGPTVLLPGSHTEQAHRDFNDSPTTRNAQLAKTEYRRSMLQQGDIAVMDARCFHFGSANNSKDRRVLFYFTIRNPAHDGDYPDCGSLFDDLQVSTSDYF
jgi:hypothetical protein